MSNKNIVKVLNQLRNSIYEMRYSLPQTEYSIDLTFYKNKVNLSNDIEVDLRNISKDEFKFVDYQSLNNLLLDNLKDLSITIKFKAEKDFDNYYYEPSEYIYSDDFSGKELSFSPELSKEESHYIKSLGIDNFSGIYLTFVIKLKGNEIQTYLERKEDNSKVKSVISKVSSYYNIYNEIISLCNNKNEYTIKYEELEDKENNKKTDLLNEFKTSYREVLDKNYFQNFMKSTIGNVSTDVYLYVNKGSRAKISSGLIFEHEGSEFHWNSYPNKIDSKKVTIPVFHSYIDNSWLVGKINNEKELNGIAYREIQEKSNFAEAVAMLLFSYTASSLSSNVYLNRESVVKLSLNKGEIVETTRTWNSIYGLNKENEIVFQLKAEEEIKDENQLKDGLNNLIKDFQA